MLRRDFQGGIVGTARRKTNEHLSKDNHFLTLAVLPARFRLVQARHAEATSFASVQGEGQRRLAKMAFCGTDVQAVLPNQLGVVPSG